MDAVSAVLCRVADGDDAVLADPETFAGFKQAVSRLRSREPFLAEAFTRAAINAALRHDAAIGLATTRPGIGRSIRGSPAISAPLIGAWGNTVAAMERHRR